MAEALDPEQTQRVIAVAGELARAGDSATLLEFVDHGLPIDCTDADGNSLLMLAAYNDQPACVLALLDRGADPNLRNHRDQVPIAGALFKGADEVVAILRAAGADLDAGTPTARQAAAMFGREHLISD